MLMMNSTAWLLAVVSSDEQADTLDFQESWAHEVADANDWAITRTWKGVSTGKNGARKILKDLLAELRELPKASRPGRVLLVRIDRLGRGDGLEAIASIAEIKRLGVGIFTRDDGEVKLERASDLLLPALKSIQAGIENEVRSDRIRAGHVRRKARGLHNGNPPYGAILLDGKPIAYDPEAILTRQLLALREQGWGYDRLAAYAAEHALPKRLKDGKTRRYKWGRSTIQRLLWCKTLRGVVVDAVTFDRVQLTTKGHCFTTRRVQSWPFPLAHAARCDCRNDALGTMLRSIWE